MSTRRDATDDVAAGWVAREDRGPLAADEAAERDAWLAQDPRRRGAYLRAHAVYLRASRAEALGAGFGERFAARRGRRHWRWLLTSAAVAVLALVAPVLPPWPGADRSGRLHETGLGEVLRVPLPDGSVATLNSGTRVRIGFDGMHRLLILERGETLLDVARDRSRPFVVRAGATEVVAVGTSFSVRRRGGDGFDVVVKEGVVDIRRTNDTIAPTRLRANFAATSRTGSDLQIEALPVARVDRRLSWRDGMLAFEGETLAVAAAEFARYSDFRVLIDDADVAGRRIVGVYSSSDPAGFARAVAASFGLQVEPVPGGIRLRRAAQARLVEAGR